MKKMSWGSLAVLVLSVSLLFTACSKAKDGTNGTNGTNGATGTANVIYSPWLDATYTFSSTDSVYEANIPAPKLVDSILQKGQMMTYMNFSTAATPDIYPLPIADIIFVEYKPAKILLSAGSPNFSTTTQGGVKVGQVRYILIPGGIAGRSVINWNDYQQVKLYLGLKD